MDVPTRISSVINCGKQFATIPNSGGGDCLFYSVSQATGVPVSKLKSTIAMMATDEEFRVKKSMWAYAKNDIPGLGERINECTDPVERTKLVALYRDYMDDVSVYSWLSNVENIEDYRRSVSSRGVWGDADALNRLAIALRAVFLVIDVDRVALYKTEIGTNHNTILPHIIIAYYSAGHFELVEEATTKRRVFSASELGIEK
jgi:hypothetical protein